MLCAGTNLCHGHLDVAQEGRCALKAVAAYALDVLHRLIQGVHPLVACCMSAHAVYRAVHHHQSALAHSSLHARRLAHERHVYLAQLGQQCAHAMLAHHLLLGTDGQQHVVGQLLHLHVAVCRDEAHHRGARIVAAEAIDTPLLMGRLVGVAGIRCRGLHRVVVRVHQQRRARVVPQRRTHIYIIIYALHLALDVGLEERLYDVGRGSLVARHRGCGDEPVEQAYGFLDERFHTSFSVLRVKVQKTDE